MNTEVRGLRFVASCPLFVNPLYPKSMKNLAILLVSFLIVACANRKAEIENAMKQYDRLTFRMAVDSLADSYLPDGELGGKGMKTYVGRDSIRKFLKSFDPASMKLISNSTKVATIDFKGDTAIASGTFEQKAKLTQGDTATYKSTFTVKWMKGEGNKWLIRKMYTIPTITIKSVLLRQLK